MERKDCSRYDPCACPLCPLDSKEDLAEYSWYPDEEVCPLKSNVWIKQQKKIAKKAKDMWKYYTLEMLKVKCRISTGITGIDPDRVPEPQIEKWLETHPLVVVSDEVKKRGAKALAEYRKQNSEKEAVMV